MIFWSKFVSDLLELFFSSFSELKSIKIEQNSYVKTYEMNVQ